MFSKDGCENCWFNGSIRIEEFMHSDLGDIPERGCCTK